MSEIKKRLFTLSVILSATMAVLSTSTTAIAKGSTASSSSSRSSSSFSKPSSSYASKPKASSYTSGYGKSYSTTNAKPKKKESSSIFEIFSSADTFEVKIESKYDNIECERQRGNTFLCKKDD